MKTLLKIERSRWAVCLDFDLQDLWVGLYWKKYYGPRIDLWFVVIPTIVLRVELVYLNIFRDRK